MRPSYTRAHLSRPLHLCSINSHGDVAQKEENQLCHTGNPELTLELPHYHKPRFIVQASVLVRCLGVEQWCSAYAPAVQIWPTLRHTFFSAAPIFDTDRSSALCLTPSVAGFGIKKRSAELGSVSDALYVQQLTPSSRPHLGPSPPPHRWWKLWPHLNTHGPVEELSLYRNCR